MSPERRHQQVLEVEQNIGSLGTHEFEAFVFSQVPLEQLGAHFLHCAALATYAEQATVEDRPDDSAWFQGVKDELLARVSEGI